MLAAEIRQFPFDDRVEFLDAQHFVQAVQERQRQLFGERERRADLQQLYVCQFFTRFHDVGIADAAGRDAFAAWRPFRLDAVEGALRQFRSQRGVSFFDSLMVQERSPREDDPLLRILDKAFRLVLRVFRFVFDGDVRVAVGHPRRGPHEHRRAVLLRKCERFLHHVVGFLSRGWVEARDLGKTRERAGILLRLGTDRTRIVRDEHDHAAFDAHVFHAHQRVGRHVQSHLLHGHEDAGAAVRRPCGHFHGRLFVDGPLDVSLRRTPLRDGLQHFRGRRAGIAAHQVDPGRERAHGDGFVAH